MIRFIIPETGKDESFGNLQKNLKSVPDQADALYIGRQKPNHSRSFGMHNPWRKEYIENTLIVFPYRLAPPDKTFI